MKYISYLIFFVFLAALIFFLKNALEPVKEPLLITGSEKCGECHILRNMGDQYSVWKRSKHSGAYYTLLSEKSKSFANKNGLKSPETEEKCLKCHSTELSLDLHEKGQYYNITEGVGCEACHGAGSAYSPAVIMKDESTFITYGGVKGDTNTCKPCHSDKGNKEQVLKDNSCPFQLNDFDYKTEFEKIKHPLNNDFK
jgi:hypothetical protein